MLTQITNGTEFSEENPSYLPVNDYVRKAISLITTWLLEGTTDVSKVLCCADRSHVVANVPEAETEFHAHEFLDATVQARPIWISPNEVYSTHRFLAQYIDSLVRLVFHTKVNHNKC